MEYYNKKRKKGYITLISMLVIAVVGTSLVAATLFNGVGSFKTSISTGQAQEALVLAETCAEKALEEIWLADDYAGSGNINLGNGACNYSVSGVSVPKTIAAAGSVGPVVKKISVTVDNLHPYITTSAWQEIP